MANRCATRWTRDLPEVEAGDFPDVLAAFRADPLHFLPGVHQQYGRAARATLGDEEVVVLSGLEANQFVFADAAQWDYRTSASVFANEFGPKYLTALNGSPHLDKRRQMSGGFRASVIATNAPLLATEAHGLLQAL
jgi:cytochrome P450